MLVVERPTWLKLIFRYRGTELEKIRLRLFSVFVLAVVVTVFEEKFDFHPTLEPLPFQLIGVALGIFLGFRNNTAYDRWWEGRKLWGGLVNTTRTFTRQVLTLVTPPKDESYGESELHDLRVALVRRTVAYVHALRLWLRDETDDITLLKFIPADEVAALKAQRNVPFAILQKTAQRLGAALRRGWIHPMHFPVLEASLTQLTDIQGACERIKNTPIPFSYTTLIHRIVALYCYLLPFGIVWQTKLFTPLVVVMISYAFFGLDAIGDEIEQPFGTDVNDLPLSAIATQIEAVLLQAVGETDLPNEPTPVDEVLL